MDPPSQVVRVQPWKKFCDPNVQAFKRLIAEAPCSWDYGGQNGGG